MEDDEKEEAVGAANKAAEPETGTDEIPVGDNEEIPPFEDLTDPKELELCYEEMYISIAQPLGIKNLLAPKPFASIPEGVEACRNIAARIFEARKEAKPTPATSKAKEKKSKEDKKKMRGEATAAKKQVAATPARRGRPAKEAPPAKPGKKAAAQAADTSSNVTRMKFRPDQVIEWVGDENPCRPGSGRYERVELLRKHNGKTVKKFLDAGGTSATLANNVNEGLIKIN